MPTARRRASALCVCQTLNIVLVVGGRNRHSQSCAELLYGDSSQAWQPWRWRALSPMHEWRDKAGMLLLRSSEKMQRILVAGGYKQSTELLKISCKNTADCGQCTLVSPLSKKLDETWFLFFNEQIFAVGRFHITLKPFNFVKTALDTLTN